MLLETAMMVHEGGQGTARPNAAVIALQRPVAESREPGRVPGRGRIFGHLTHAVRTVEYSRLQ